MISGGNLDQIPFIFVHCLLGLCCVIDTNSLLLIKRIQIIRKDSIRIFYSIIISLRKLKGSFCRVVQLRSLLTDKTVICIFGFLGVGRYSFIQFSSFFINKNNLNTDI